MIFGKGFIKSVFSIYIYISRINATNLLNRWGRNMFNR